MTTIRGFVRSYAAAVNRVQKAKERAQRLEEKSEVASLIRQSIAAAEAAAQTADQYTEEITSLHHEIPDKIDWVSILSEPAPVAPVPTYANAQKARAELDLFNPGMIGKVFGGNRKREILLTKVSTGLAEDETINAKANLEYQEAQKEWLKFQDLAEGVLNGDTEVYVEAFRYLNPLADIQHIGPQASLKFQPDYVLADIEVHSAEIVPKEVYSRTPTGKISKKALSPVKARQLYQDYVCSVALRSASEILALLPVRFTIVNALADMLNTSTGINEQRVILSVAIFPETLSGLKMPSLDPSDSMQNFVHNMKFSSNGFTAVERIEPERFSPEGQL